MSPRPRTGDGKVDQADIDAVSLYLNGSGRLTPLEAVTADTNDDGQVTSEDLNQPVGRVCTNTPFPFVSRPI